jgi:hypothetical protein
LKRRSKKTAPLSFRGADGPLAVYTDRAAYHDWAVV